MNLILKFTIHSFGVATRSCDICVLIAYSYQLEFFPP